MGIYYLGNLGVGLVLGPLLGGILTESWGWRSAQWFLACYGGTILTLIMFCLPETSPRQTVITIGLEKSHSTSEGTRAEPPATTTATKRFNLEITWEILIGLLVTGFVAVGALRWYGAGWREGKASILSISIARI